MFRLGATLSRVDANSEGLEPSDPRQEIRDAVAREVRALRGRRRMSQAELIAKTGISKSAMRRLEGAERDMDIPQAIAIASAFGISVAELLQAVQDSLEGKQL